MSQLVPFSFLGAQVRIVDIEGKPHFVGKDVCDVLGYTNATKAMNDHCRGVTNRYPLSTPGGEQVARVLGEGDVMRLIVRSKMAHAVRFERWVFDEVLPQIRETGSYGAKPFDFTNPHQMLEAITVYATKQIELERTIALQTPHVQALARLSVAEGDMSLSEAAKQVDMPPRKFNMRMCESGWIFKTTPNGHWNAYADKTNAGLLSVRPSKPKMTGDGREKVYPQVMVTPKGLTAIARALARSSRAIDREINRCASLFHDDEDE